MTVNCTVPQSPTLVCGEMVSRFLVRNELQFCFLLRPWVSTASAKMQDVTNAEDVTSRKGIPHSRFTRFCLRDRSWINNLFSQDSSVKDSLYQHCSDLHPTFMKSPMVAIPVFFLVALKFRRSNWTCYSFALQIDCVWNNKPMAFFFGHLCYCIYFALGKILWQFFCDLCVCVCEILKLHATNSRKSFPQSKLISVFSDFTFVENRSEACQYGPWKLCRVRNPRGREMERDRTWRRNLIYLWCFSRQIVPLQAPPK